MSGGVGGVRSNAAPIPIGSPLYLVAETTPINVIDVHPIIPSATTAGKSVA